MGAALHAPPRPGQPGGHEPAIRSLPPEVVLQGWLPTLRDRAASSPNTKIRHITSKDVNTVQVRIRAPRRGEGPTVPWCPDRGTAGGRPQMPPAVSPPT